VSVEVRIILPKRLYEILEKKAREQRMKVQDLIVVAISKLAEEGG